MDIELQVKERDEHGQIKTTDTKTFYYPQETASDWVKAPRSMWWGKKNSDVPQFTSAIRTKTSGRGGVVPNQLGCMMNNSNNVAAAQQLTAFFTGAIARDPGVYITEENWRRCIALFAARKSIKGNWINDKDEYCAPNEDYDDYDQWVDDAHVYALFNASSQQSSLRDIDYKDESWDIENEFFWMHPDTIQDLADKQGYMSLYQDAQMFGEERYMYKQLQSLTLSDDAQWLLDEAVQLVKDSMPFRKTQAQQHTDMHLQAWDAGWYQIRKGILEDLFPNRYTRFVKKYKAFEDRMREGVYDFGFLRS